MGHTYADALAASEVWARSSGALAIHAFDQIETVLGQSTIGLEFTEQAPAVDKVLVAVGGGGLIGGVAAWYAGATRVVGVEPVEAPTLTRALAAGAPVDSPVGGIAAHSLAPGASAIRVSACPNLRQRRRARHRRRHHPRATRVVGSIATSQNRAARRRSRRCFPAPMSRRTASASE